MRKLIVVIPILLVIMFLFYIDGNRFTAKSAAKNSVFLEEDAELIGEHEVGKDNVFIFKSEKEKQYWTVLTEKRGLFYKSSIATYYPFNSDDLQLIGGLSFKSDNNAGTTVFSVVSNTEKVGYIELSLDEKFQRKEISKGERVTFIFPYSELDFLNPTAFDEEGNALYYFGYPKGENVIKHEDFRWHKFEGDNSGG